MGGTSIGPRMIEKLNVLVRNTRMAALFAVETPVPDYRSKN